MTHENITQKRAICIALIAVIAFAAVFAVTGLHSSAGAVGHTHDAITFTEWTSNSSLPTEAGSYYLTQDVVLSGPHYFRNDISLCLNGHSITNTGEGPVLGTLFSDSLTFNLYDCDDTEHKYCIHDYVAVVDDSLTENYETFKGGYITGGKDGAVDNNATFNMYGGTLIGNTGVSPAVGSMKVFRMYGGAIIGNYASGMTAGVGAGNTNQDASHIYLYGGKIIENTSAGYGGGVVPGAYKYSKYVVGSLEGHEALIVRDNYAQKGSYYQDYYHESNLFVWRSSDHPLITMEFQNSAVTPEIGITVDDNVEGRVFASCEDYPDYYSDSWINYFFSDDPGYKAAMNTDSEEYYGDFYLKALPQHRHSLTYTVSGATITATCTADGCPLENNKATLTIHAPTGNLFYDKGVKEATLSAYDVKIFTPGAIVYYKDGVESERAPMNAGTYVAKVTSNGMTAQVTFTIKNWAIRDPDQQDVKVEIQGAEPEEDIRLKVEVKAEIAADEATGEYSEAIKNKIAENETVAIVYEVKLLRLTIVNGVETLEEIQPSDIREGTTLRIAMKIPEELKGKAFRVLHIHGAGDVSEAEYTVSANGELINVETDRLSEFAFLLEKTANGGTGTVSTRHGFCVGWIVFIFVMLELLYLALYVLLRLPKAAFLVKKCKLGALDDFRKDHILFGRVDLLHFIGLCVSGAVFLFALVALCVHVCPVTVVCFVFALLILAAFLFFLIQNRRSDVPSGDSKKAA